MGGEALHLGSQESSTGPEAVRIDGGGSGTDRLGVGSEAQRDHSNYPVPPQGQGDRGAQGPDHRASQGQCRSAGLSKRPGPEVGGGGGSSSSNGGGANPSRGGEQEVARHLPEVLRLRGIRRRRGNQGPALRPVYEETGSHICAEGTSHAGRLQ